MRENITLSVDEIRRILLDKHIFSPRIHKATIKRINKQRLIKQQQARNQAEIANEDIA